MTESRAAAENIEVVVNGEPRSVTAGLNLSELLAELSIDGGRVAVELDRQIVRKADWDSTHVHPGARIEVVWFVGGGWR